MSCTFTIAVIPPGADTVEDHDSRMRANRKEIKRIVKAVREANGSKIRIGTAGDLEAAWRVACQGSVWPDDLWAYKNERGAVPAVFNSLAELEAHALNGEH